MGTRRKFLVDSARTLVGGLAVLTSGGCEDRRYSYRRDKIEAIQKSAQSFAKYTYGEGYVYDVNIPKGNGEETERAHVNLSAGLFTERSNLLKYDLGGLSVRVYKSGTIEVLSGGVYITDPTILNLAQEKTDKVLEAVAEENNRLREKRIEKILKDLKR